MTRGGRLFWGKNLSALIRRYESAIGQEVAGWERNRVLASSETDVVSYLVERYTLHTPQLLRDQMHVESEGEAKIDLPCPIHTRMKSGGSIRGSRLRVCLTCFDPRVLRTRRSWSPLSGPLG